MELIIIIVLLIALAIITIKYIIYRRQVHSICRQLEFLENDLTNHKIRTDLTKKEVVKLAELINHMCESHNKKEIALINKDKHLKETLTAVSHDIRTPLTSLKGYFELLMSEEEPEKKLQYSRVMGERMDNLSDLLDELFTYTKLQNEDYKLELEKQDLTKLVLDTIFSFYEIFKQKNYEPELDIDDRSYIVNCNDIAIKRVISNIIKNSIIHGMGKIKISYKITEDGKISFECSNTIAHPENMDVSRVFDRFYKADKSRKEKSTGLGLAISKEMVERMKGTISASLIGNTFEIKVIFDIAK